MSRALLQNPHGSLEVKCFSSAGSKFTQQISRSRRPCIDRRRTHTVCAGSFNGRPFSRSATANEDILEDILKGVVDTFLFPSNVQGPRDILQLAVDEYEGDGYYQWCADLPGVKRDQLKVQIKDGSLIISGKRELNAGSADNPGHSGRRIRRAERQSGKFFRKVQLPADADHASQNIHARVSDGVLEVTVYKLPARHTEVDIDF